MSKLSHFADCLAADLQLMSGMSKLVIYGSERLRPASKVFSRRSTLPTAFTYGRDNRLMMR
jgi:hypothetical protein